MDTLPPVVVNNSPKKPSSRVTQSLTNGQAAVVRVLQEVNPAKIRTER